MKLKNSTKITQDVCLEYLKTRKRILSKFYLICFIFLLFYACAFITLLLITNNNKLALILSALFFLSIIYMICLYLKLPEVALKKSYPGDKTFYYNFTEKSFEVIDNPENSKSDVTIEYLLLRRICETEKFFYLFHKKYDAYIINKAGFENPDDIENLRQVLKSSEPLGRYHYYDKLT